MKLPTGGGFSQQLSGTIRLDVTAFQADARKMADEAKKSAKNIESAYKLTGQQAALGLQQAAKATTEQRRQMEAAARSAIALEKQKSAEISRMNRDLAAAEKQQRREATQIVRQAAAEEKRAAREVETARRQALAAQKQAAREAAAETRRLAQEEKRAAKEVADALKLKNKPYNDLRVSVGEARTQLIAFTAAAAGTVYVGLQAADSVRLLTIRYRELAGSQAAGERLMRQVEKTAREMNLPIRQTQESFLGLIPAVRQANGSLEEYTNVALRLATLNTDSRGGVEGAIYAIREALSSGGTDLVSLSERFNIPRKILREYIEQTGDLAKALDILLDKYGATDVAVKANARSLSNLAAQLQDTAKRALERTFAGALETAQNLISGLNAALENTPQWLIDLGATATLAVGGITALVLATELLATAHIRGLTALKAYATYMATTVIPHLKSAAAAVKAFAVSQAGIRLGVGAGALAVGTGLGIGAVNLAGRVTGNERLANFGLDDVINTIKQLLFVGINLILDVLQGLTGAIASVITWFRNLGLTAQDLGLRFTVLFAELGIGIQQFLGVFGDANEIKRLQGVRAGALAGIEEIAVEWNTSMSAIQNRTTSVFRDIRLGIYEALFPVPETVKTELQTIGEAFDQLILGIKTKLYDFYEEQGDRFADSVGDIVNFRQELNALFEEGDITALESRLRGLERERDAIESVLPELERHAEYSEEAAKQLAEYRTRLEEITNTLPQFLDALEAVTERGIGKATEEYLEAIAKIDAKRDEDLLKLSADTADKERDLAQKEADKLDDIQDKEAEAEAAYQKAMLKAEETFRKRMLEIQRNYLRAVTLAASQLDAAGVIAALQTRTEQRRQANEQRAEAHAAALERLNEQRAAAAQALEDLRVELEQRRAEIEADRQARFNAIQAEHREASQLASDALGAELTRIQEYYTRRYNDLVAYQAAERALTLQNQAQYLQDLANAVIYPTLNEIMSNPLVKSLLAAGGAFAQTATGGAFGGTQIGQALFNIYDATDPEAVAQTVNAHLVRLSTGGRAGLG